MTVTTNVEDVTMRRQRPAGRLRGFTLTELLVVLATTGLLATALVPAATGTRKLNRTASCGANMGQLAAALQAYQSDHAGYLPCAFVPQWGMSLKAVWSEAAWYMPKRELWFYKICPSYVKQPGQLICPQDPHAEAFDFEAVDPNTALPHSNTLVPSCGYGLNYILPKNPQTAPPLWADRTILLADIGPDGPLQTALLYASSDDSPLGQPWRDGGRLTWDDGNNRGWFTGPTWLTTRHGKGINMAAMDGSVRPARTVEILAQPFKRQYTSCYRLELPSRTDVCSLCNANHADTTHYNFSDSNFWWWTGPLVNTQAVSAPVSQR